MTLDQLIASLQAQKAAGVDGATPVGIPSLDNNRNWGMVQLDIVLSVSSVAKDEHSKGWTICRKVTRGGVPVVLISG